MPTPSSPDEGAPTEPDAPSPWHRRRTAPGVVSLGARVSKELWTAPGSKLQSMAREAMERWSGTELQDITDILRESLSVDVAAVSVLDDEAFHYLVCSGLGPFVNPRDQALCDLAMDVDGFMEIPDLSLDERTRNYAVVDGRAMSLRYFASCPLVAGGQLVGRVCLFDHKPRHLDAYGRRLLTTLAHGASAAVDGRLADHGDAGEAAGQTIEEAYEPVEREPESLDGPLTVLRAALEALDTVLVREEAGELARSLAVRARQALAEVDRRRGRDIGGDAALDAAEASAVDLGEVMDEMETDLFGLVHPVGGSVSHHGLATVVGTRAQLYSVLLTLVSTALAEAQPGGAPKVTVSGDEDDHGFTVRVRAEGDGLARQPAAAQRLFDAMSEGDAESSGLAEARCIIERHGGIVGVESDRHGGIEVWFTVPDE